MLSRAGRCSALRELVGPCARRGVADRTVRGRVYEESDFVLLRNRRKPEHAGNLVKLKRGKKLTTHRGDIAHNDVIGKSVRQIVKTNRGTEFRICEPTLGQYVELTRRLVTPIYANDANTIVSLLDIHVDTPPLASSSSTPPEEPLEILEAGTGHGALTLHLARAIHAANPRIPEPPTYTSIQEGAAATLRGGEDNTPSEHNSQAPDIEGSGTGKNESYGTAETGNGDVIEDPVYLGESVIEVDTGINGDTLEVWKRTQRRAVIHSIDASATHSKHARETVQGFRQGMYARDVEFYVGDVSEWTREQLSKRRERKPFLTHAILDLPSSFLHIEAVTKALKTDGVLAAFNPSITQILDCAKEVGEKRLSLALETVVELGQGGLRVWDVRREIPRKVLRKREKKAALEVEKEKEKESSKIEETVLEDDVLSEAESGEPNDVAKRAQKEIDGAAARDKEQEDLRKAREEEEFWVCRPKVGEMVVGGGFIALWRKMDMLYEE